MTQNFVFEIYTVFETVCFDMHRREERKQLYLLMQGFWLHWSSRVYVKKAGAGGKKTTYFVMQLLGLDGDAGVLHDGVDVHLVRHPWDQVLEMTVKGGIARTDPVKISALPLA